MSYNGRITESKWHTYWATDSGDKIEEQYINAYHNWSDSFRWSYKECIEIINGSFSEIGKLKEMEDFDEMVESIKLFIDDVEMEFSGR